MSLPSSRHSHELPPRKRPSLLVTVLPRKAPRPRLPRLSHPRPRCPPNPAGGGKPPPQPSSFRLLCFILRAFLAAAYSKNTALADTRYRSRLIKPERSTTANSSFLSSPDSSFRAKRAGSATAVLRGHGLSRCIPGSGGLRPALRMAQHEIGKHRDVIGPLVEGANVMQAFAASEQKGILVEHGDLFQRLEAIGGKTGTDDIDMTSALFGPALQGLVGIRLQPLGTAETRLKTHLPLPVAQLQALRNETCGLVAFAVVRVAQQQRASRHAVKGK